MKSREYNYIIIGAGISGLNLADKILNKNPKLHVELFDSAMRVGGRVHTITDKDETYEAGAARYNDGHQKLHKLIKRFNLSKNPPTRLISVHVMKKAGCLSL